MKLLSLFLVFFITLSTTAQNAKKIPVELKKFDFTYTDEYQWMENVEDADLKKWVRIQDSITTQVLEQNVNENNFLFKIKDYDYLSTNGLPRKKGRYFYSNYRLDKNKPSVLHYREKLNDPPKELVNPYSVYHDENAIIMSYKPSKNSTYLAYQVSLDGSDKKEIRFVDIPNQKYLDDVIKDVKFSGIAWNGNDGIFYKKNSNTSFFAADSTFQIFYHKIGDLQEKDKLVFDASLNNGKLSFSSYKDKLFIIEENKNETATNYYYINLLTDNDFTVYPFIKNNSNTFSFISYYNGFVYCKPKNYPWGSVSKFSLENPDEKITVIPQIYNHLLLNTFFIEDNIVCKYKYNGRFYFNIYTSDGKFIRKFEAPLGMDMFVNFWDEKKENLFTTFYSHTIPFLNYKLNIKTGENTIYYNDYARPKPTLFPFNYFETKITTYKSRDGKDIPITIIHKKDLELTGNNPTLLKAYGGFGSISSPNYDTGLLHFLKKGGIYAYAEIRGGGDKGENWHKNGSGLNKMNSFNDFIDAAEYLIAENYTSPDKLAITGGSHGGLVVGVALTQRPDLFKVAVPVVGVFDMFKYDEYTVGIYHLDEFGNPNNKEEFEYMMNYSPLHNIKEDINYPTTLIITSENDDRVPPIHSYKFAAKLQNREAQKNPIYLQVQSNSGHYGKISNYNSRVKQQATFYSFIWDKLNE
ncbi:prolyl oligopeptidase family serine peptidase [Flavobacterium sp.]|uniref:prolyl oligopeptidase family serine peptidase n=1 Tax=Flavobacterium sp. TaxID=239 RepID=UPI003527EA53